jgi:hypothetical protein
LIAQIERLYQCASRQPHISFEEQKFTGAVEHLSVENELKKLSDYQSKESKERRQVKKVRRQIIIGTSFLLMIVMFAVMFTFRRVGD